LAHPSIAAIKPGAADRLAHSEFADHLMAALLDQAADEGLAAALAGPWGQDKTPVLNARAAAGKPGRRAWRLIAGSYCDLHEVPRVAWRR
jgi:hypothetical protein